MIKIGDFISSHAQKANPTNPFDRCKYCNNLSTPTKRQGSFFRGRDRPLCDFLGESRNQDCPWCGLLVQCINILEPEVEKMIQDNPDQPMWCVINRHNSIYIGWNYTGNVTILERYSFQLYKSPSTEPLPDGLDIPTCPELAPEPGHELMWDHLRQCLMKCLWSHSECRAAQQLDWFPKRLLYIESTGGEQSHIRLIDTDEHHPLGPYISLSHCWGQTQHLRLLTTNIATFHQRIDLGEMPATLQNCITAARKFGVNYIWIDSICIIQDDRADWAFHAQQMDKIFENAIIVVSAISSKDGSMPFLGPEAPNVRHSKVSHPVELEPSLGSRAPIRIRRFLPDDADLTEFTGPLMHRAWAWQEHVLSTRIVHFTEAQTIWECVQARGSEMMGSFEPRSDAMRTRLRGNEGIDHEWQRAVHNFGKRGLTYPTDRLPAFSGVAARFQPLFQTDYCAGLWRQRMVLDLAWEQSHKLSILSGKLVASYDNSVPSWSWASIRGAVLYGLEDEFSGATVKYSVVNVNCEPSTENAMGEVRPGSFVELEGHYIPATLLADERGFAVIAREGFEPQLVMPDCQLIEVKQTVGEKVVDTVRRALPSEQVSLEVNPNTGGEVVNNEAKPDVSGSVICLLLFDGNLREDDTECAIVLILAPLSDPDGQYNLMQRVALGRGGSEKVDDGTSSIPWQWTNYETWTNWEALFAGAKKTTFRVL